MSLLLGVLAAGAFLVWPSPMPEWPRHRRGARARDVPRDVPRDVRPVWGSHCRTALWERVAPALRGGRAPGRGASHTARGSAPVVELVELLLPTLRAGATPADAVAVVASTIDGDGPSLTLLHELGDAAGRGQPLAPVWRRHAGATQSRELSFLAASWALSESAGAPLAAGLAAVAGVLRQQERARQQLTAAAAGPRASMAVLAGLPATGPAIGLLFGLPPTELYGSSRLALACLIAGLGLAGSGWWWGRRLLRRAMRPTVVA